MSDGSRGGLVIAGCGINVPRHVTWEVRREIERAEALPYFVTNPVASFWLKTVNPRAHAIDGFHSPSVPRERTFHDMVSAIMAPVRAGLRTCAVFYGHPGLYARPPWDALRLAVQEGYSARMLPGISAEDCLLVDLGLDPAREGCQSYDATDFLLRPRNFDARVPLILWQVAVTGRATGPAPEPHAPGLAILAELLSGHYGGDHTVCFYEAATAGPASPLVRYFPLRALSEQSASALTTLFVPPLCPAPVNLEIADRLGLRPPPSSLAADR